MKQATFKSVTAYNNMFKNDAALTSIIIDDSSAKSWIESRIGEAGLTNITISKSV